MRARLGIDFAKKSGRPGRLWLAAGVISVLLLVMAVMQWRIAGLEQEAQRSQLADTAEQAVRMQQEEAERAAKEDPKRIAAINRAIAALNVPWAKTLSQIEHSRPNDVALLRLEPRIQDKRIRVIAQADTAEQLFAFLNAMVAEKVFPSVLPVRQERVSEEGKKPCVKLTFDVEWAL